jgi:hypothetical protein
MKRQLPFLALALLALPLAGCGGSSDDDNGPNPVGESFVAVRGNQLLRGDVNNADRAASTLLTGLPAGVEIRGIDYRPNGGTLYALGSNSRLYTINLATSAVTPVGGGAFDPATTGGAFGFDFNPQADRIRVIGDDGQSLRINPDTNAVVVDTSISDVNADIVAAAYTDNDNDNGTPTTLFAIDANSDSLVRIGGVDSEPSPNLGAVTNIASLNFEVSMDTAFDITDGNDAYLVSGRDVYSLNLVTGDTDRLSRFDDPVDAFTIIPPSS